MNNPELELLIDMLENEVDWDSDKFKSLKSKLEQDLEKVKWINDSGLDFSQLNSALVNYHNRCESIEQITKGQEEWKLRYFDLQQQNKTLTDDNEQLREIHKKYQRYN